MKTTSHGTSTPRCERARWPRSGSPDVWYNDIHLEFSLGGDKDTPVHQAAAAAAASVVEVHWQVVCVSLGGGV
jgi:hypothetical protein